MRRRYKKSTLDKISRDIMIISSLFLVFVILGSLLNKFFPQYTDVVIKKLNYTNNYYNCGIDIKKILISNLKIDFLLLISIVICTLTIILAPLGLVILGFKGISIGYIINSLTIGFKGNAIKLIILTLIKFSIILPGMIILLLISFKYLMEFLKNINKNNKINCTYLIKRYIINSFLIIIFSLSGQTILNAIYTMSLKLF